jgi:hypothetical protein
MTMVTMMLVMLVMLLLVVAWVVTLTLTKQKIPCGKVTEQTLF